MTPLAKQDVLEQLAKSQPAFHHYQGQAHIWHASSGTLQFIADTVKPDDLTAETGSGASTVVFAAAGARHTAISPEPNEHRSIREFCVSLGVPIRQLNFEEGFSEEILPSYSPPSSLDLAFVDGRHSFPHPILDWHYLSRHLRVGGTMLLDDVGALAVQTLCRVMLADDAWQFETALDGEAAAFVKRTDPSPEDRWLDQRIASTEELERCLEASSDT